MTPPLMFSPRDAREGEVIYWGENEEPRKRGGACDDDADDDGDEEDNHQIRLWRRDIKGGEGELGPR